MLDIIKKYVTAAVIERDYKRFKSFEYNKEYLFYLNKTYKSIMLRFSL